MQRALILCRHAPACPYPHTILVTLSLSLSSHYLTPLSLSLYFSLNQPSIIIKHNHNTTHNMMGTSVCSEQQHKFHHSHQLCYLSKKSLDIPPRKLLTRRPSHDAVFLEDDAVFSKFLPYNNVDDDDSDPYSSDHFRIYEFKVRKCNRSRSHDWTDCPFAHPGEKARRRDPRRFHYSGTVCSEFRKGHCSKGDNCEFSHGVFECWLHPSRYRTEACKDGKNCKRKVCFFAHSTRQLRIVPDTSPSPPSDKLSHCCAYCHSNITASPTSTLMGMSHASPPMSPPISPVYGASRFGSLDSGVLSELSYKEALNELMASFEAMNAHESAPSPAAAAAASSLPWLDVNFNVEEQPQFVLSPSTPTPASRGRSKFFAGERKFFHGEYSGRNPAEESGASGPDLGWVNDLLT